MVLLPALEGSTTVVLLVTVHLSVNQIFVICKKDLIIASEVITPLHKSMMNANLIIFRISFGTHY